MNDSVFGYLTSSSIGYRRHLTSISTGGAVLAVAFCIPFNPLWSLENSDAAVALHFFVSLFCYESMFSFVMVAHTSLLADITTLSRERERCNLYGAVAGAVGSLSVFVGTFWWQHEDLFAFRLFCLLIACVAAGAFQVTAELCERAVVQSKKRDELRVVINYDDSSEHGGSGAKLPLGVFWQQVCLQRNVWYFGGISFIQVLNCHFNSNFMPYLVRIFIGEAHAVLQSLVVGAAAALPHALVAALAPVVHTHGVVYVLRRLTQLRVVTAVVVAALFIALPAFAQSLACIGVVAVFLVVNKLSTEAVCRHRSGVRSFARSCALTRVSLSPEV
jgi:Na+/melibiose symporter-like transporter